MRESDKEFNCHLNKLVAYIESLTGGIRITPRRLPILHPSICALDAVYSIVHQYELFDDYNAVINKGFIENYCNYIEGTTPLVIRPTRGLKLAIGQTEDTLNNLKTLIERVTPDMFGPVVMGDSSGDGRGYKVPATNEPKPTVVLGLVEYLLSKDPRTNTLAGLRNYVQRVDFGEKPWKSIKGIGPLTFKYFCMLAGDGATIKLDTHLKKLVTCIISTRRGEKYSNSYLEKLVLAAAAQLGILAKTLDNWLWDHARSSGLCPKCGSKH